MAMISFLEGLPGSGKSFELVKMHIAKALRDGRECVGYLEGIGDADCQVKLAEAAGVPLARIKELLFPLTREQVRDLPRYARRNALHFIDEAQNFWPNKAKLTDAFTQFVAEHRHRGEDYVLAGQDLRDVHVLWRRRVNIKYGYMKLDAVGFENKYSVTTYRNVGADEFAVVGTAVDNTYDPKFFGTYRSHVDQDVRTQLTKDGRASVFSSKLLKYGVPASLVAALVGGWYIVHWFNTLGDPPPRPAIAGAAASGPAVGGVAPLPRAAPPVRPSPGLVVAPVDDGASLQERLLVKLDGEGKLRLAGLLQTSKGHNGVIEWVKDSRVQERFTLNQLRDLGVAVVVGDGVVRLGVGKWERLATMWPIEAPIGEATAQQVKAHAKPEEAPLFTAPAVIAASPGPAIDRPGGPVDTMAPAPRVRLPSSR